MDSDTTMKKKKRRRRREKEADLLFSPDNETREALAIAHANRKCKRGHRTSNCTVD